MTPVTPSSSSGYRTPRTPKTPVTASSTPGFPAAADWSGSGDSGSSWSLPPGVQPSPFELRCRSFTVKFDYEDWRRLSPPYYDPACPYITRIPRQPRTPPSPWLVYERGLSRKIPRPQWSPVDGPRKKRASSAWGRSALSPCTVIARSIFITSRGWSAKRRRDIWHRRDDMSVRPCWGRASWKCWRPFSVLDLQGDPHVPNAPPRGCSFARSREWRFVKGRVSFRRDRETVQLQHRRTSDFLETSLPSSPSLFFSFFTFHSL